MPTPDRPETSAPSWFEAQERTLDPLLNAYALVSLVEGAEAVGLLRALRTGDDASGLARAVGLGESRVRDLCDALVAGGVAEPSGSGFRLTADWEALTGAAAYAPLAATLRMNRVTSRALRNPRGSSGYGELPPEDRLTYAGAVSPDPFSPGYVALVRQGAWTPASLRARVRDDDRHLELGCGVAGRILCALQAFPAMTAVGVEREADLAAEARRRAEALGVADRFEVVCADATEVRLEGGFDVVTWSQFFFPAASRAGTLATAHASLRPDGLLVAPLLGDDEALVADPHGTEAQGVRLTQVVLGGWGVPRRSGSELAAEVTAAGFTDATVTSATESPFRVVFATRP